MDESFVISANNLEKSTKAELDFIFTEAEKQVKESLESGKDVLTRSTILLTVILGIITSFLSVIFTAHRFNALNLTLSMSVIYALLILYKIQKNIRGQDYFTTGAQPKDLLHDWYFENYPNGKDRVKEILITQINSFQERLISNNNLNQNRWIEFKQSLNMSIIFPIIFIILYIVNMQLICLF